MSIIQWVREHIAHAVENGHANEFPQPVQDLAHRLAEEIHKLGAGVDIEHLVQTQIQKLQPRLDVIAEELNTQTRTRIEQLATGLETRISEIVEAKFNDLLAKAAAADAPQASPVIVSADAPAEAKAPEAATAE